MPSPTSSIGAARALRRRVPRLAQLLAPVRLHERLTDLGLDGLASEPFVDQPEPVLLCGGKAAGALAHRLRPVCDVRDAQQRVGVQPRKPGVHENGDERPLERQRRVGAEHGPRGAGQLRRGPSRRGCATSADRAKLALGRLQQLAQEVVRNLVPAEHARAAGLRLTRPTEADGRANLLRRQAS